ncbi:DUF4214 domain-containing protein [Massilia aerilata]|uniref:DUF4214 domain-containing protein n=1 Tax=Massilia aerilata TaxID=453817 RepID=A0ABW0RU26_9BURK
MAFTPGAGAVISFSVEGAQASQRQIEGVGGSFGQLTTAAKGSLKELAAFAGFGLGMKAIAEQVLGAQRDFDKLNASLITATGSTAEAAQTFKSLQAFASSTPYSVAEATEAFIKMKNLGLDPSERALRSYGNTASAMGKGLDQMIEAVADAATGEFERLKEFGITASQAGDKVALTFKGTTITVGKNADEIQGFLQKLGNTDFAGAMALRAATLDGAISNLSDKWSAFVLQLSQSGVGDAAKFGVGVLADNLTLLAGAVATVATAKLATTIDGWVTATRRQITETATARAATIAAAEADVASATAKTTQLTATQAMIVVAREEAVAKLASANTSIAAAEASIAAASAAGAQSFALRTVRLATAELQVAEAQRTAMLAELAVLGTQQASVSAKVTAALAAQTAAQNTLTGATAAGGAAAGLASRALTLLGGPVGAIITVLGLAATAWVWYKQKQDEATADASQNVGEMTEQIVGDLEKQNQKLRERVELSRQAGMGPVAAQGGEAVERMAELLKKINDLKAQGAALSPSDAVEMVTYQGEYDALKKVVEVGKDLKTTLDASSKSATDLREKMTGVGASYVADLAALKSALDAGQIAQDDYAKAVKKLAADTFNGSQAGKDYAKSLDLTSAAITHQAEVQTLLNQRKQEHIQFLRNTGQIDGETAIKRTTAAQIESLGIEKAALSQQLALASRKTDSEKEQADLAGKVAVIGTKINNARKKEAEDLFLLEQQNYRQAVGNSSDLIEKEQAELASLRQQTQAQIDQNEQIGLTTRQVAELTAMRLQEAAARKDAEAIIAEGLDLTGERAQRIRDEAAALRERAQAVTVGAVKQDLYEKPLQDLNAMVDIMSSLDQAAQSAAQGMAQSFGTMGQAIGGMTTALTGFERTQAAIAAQLANSLRDAHGDPVKIQRANQMATEASAQAQIKSYGDMASAAKGFFNENSKGYAVLQGVEKAYRAAEMVMALESMTKKILFKETEVAANTTLNATRLTGEAAASAASTGLAATEASAWGITAVVKAIASMPFPLNLAAGAATLAAVVGIGAKIMGSVGGSGVSLSQQRQKAQGAGSILGDSDAKSESIKRALDAVEKNTYQGLAISNGMLATLRSIDSNIGAFSSHLVSSTDISNPDIALKSGVSGANMGTVALTAAGFAAGSMVSLIGSVMGPIGALAGLALSRIPAVQKLMTSVFGGKQSVSDSGFGMDAASLASIMGNGAHAYQYADITTSGGWFSSDKHSEQSNPLADAANAQFTAIITSLADSVKSAGSLLGLSGDDFTAKLNSFVVDIGHVSLKDLKGDELQKAVEAVFSKLGDDMAQYAVGGLQELQQVGEGYLETLSRVATEYQTIDVVFQSFGKTFGEVGLASVAARDRLVQLAGGLDKFTSQGEYFLTNFFSEQEQANALKARVQPVLDQYGLQASGEGAMRALRDFVVGLDTTTEAGAQAYTTLMQYAPAIKQIADAGQKVYDERKDLQDQLDELTMSSAQLLAKQRDALEVSNRSLFDQIQATKAAKDAEDARTTALQRAADERKGLQDQYDEATMSSVQLLAKQRDALDESNRSLFDQVQAVKAQAAAIDAVKANAATLLGGVNDAFSVLQKVTAREKTAIQASVDTHTAAFNKLQSLSQALHGTLDSLQSPEQKLYARAAAQAEIRADLAITKAGGSLSDAQVESLKKALGSVTQDASGQFSSYADYMRDLLQTQNDISKLGDITDDSLSVEQKSLDALNDQLKRLDDIVANGQAQIDALNGQSIATLSLAQAMSAFKSSIGAAQANPVVAGTSTIAGYYQELFDRAPDQAGLKYWQDILATGASLSNIKAAMMGSDEYKTLHPFAVGTNFVPRDMPAYLHAGEAVIPAADNRLLFSVLSRAANPQGNNEVLAAAVDRLTATVAKQQVVIERQEAALQSIAKSSLNTEGHLDAAINGEKPLATKVIKEEVTA